MLSLLFQLSQSVVTYSLNINELHISGEGSITREGARSKGLYTEITKIFIEEGPSSINEYAFQDFLKVSYVYISKTVQTIGEYVFRSCSSLKKFEVDPKSEYFCNNDQFCLYSKDMHKLVMLTKVKNPKIPDGVVEIETNAFTIGGFNFGDVIFPKTLKIFKKYSLDCGLFHDISFAAEAQLETLMGFAYTSINQLTIPKSVTTISGNAFFYSNIATLVFEENSALEIINEGSFNKLNVEVINLPNAVKEIQDSAFSESSVKTITIGTDCFNISTNAFLGCNLLQKIDVSEQNIHFSSVDGILMNKGNEQIIFVPNDKQNITISSKVTDIGQTVLQSAKSLTKIELQSKDIWDTKDGILYSKNFETVVAICGGVISAQIDSRVNSIGPYAAYGCNLLKTISFSGILVNFIGFKAFFASGIESFELPNSVLRLSRESFTNTLNLTTFKINPESKLKIIDLNCFQSSGITSFYFGKDVSVLEPGILYGCKSLKTITFHPNIKLTSLGIYGLENCGVENIKLPASLTVIDERCFRYCKSLETVSFEDNSALTSINEIAFYQCILLREVILPDSCESLGNQAFGLCSSLNVFVHNLKTMNSGSFVRCTSLRSFNFSSRQTELLDTSIFMNCNELVEFTVDAGNNKLKCINGDLFSYNETILKMFPPGKEMALIPTRTVMFADNAFYGSTKLKYVAFFSGSELTSIGNGAFYECKKLETVQFPPKLSHIMSRGFFGCSSLKAITFPDSLTTIDDSAFIGCSNAKVKYCGTNIIEGQNIFEPNTKVYVTDLYNSDDFCSINVEKKLTYNCDMKIELNKVTCDYKRIYNPNVLSLIALIMLYKD